MSTFRFDVISLCPKAFETLDELGVISRAFSSNIAELEIHNPRDFTIDRYRKVDDEPYGGGVGMVLKPEPVFAAYKSIPLNRKRRVLMMSPQGKPLEQNDLQRWSADYDQLIILCGHYEGFDERIRTLADEEVSTGDFVLTGGELPAMVVVNGVVRLLPGTLGTEESLLEESHTDLLLEHPQYTRPANFQGMEVPYVLRSGDHGAISTWREKQRQLRTKQRRPDLYVRWLVKQQLSQSTIDELLGDSVNNRIGNGYDIHRLVPERALILGGVKLDHPDGLGLEGHSDADVLAHAVTDALLGALALGDIGKYFPPEDPEWEGADSLLLLEKVVALVRDHGWQIVNVDAVIVAERPKLKPYIDLMRQNLAERLGVALQSVGIKATTNERLGPEGREEGISSHAVALLERL
ncbi:tRNA (guanosine(37)-N1)-methyltransferase TrmD [Prochlorococcus sp. MIT 1307]|uniref:tRNA (guanosine(37)-N1)-methyltransferase TrmD n=1 Tax=Prochlorococcus sp. MIT 1307 TaxID=3096219 RepID=UPI002A7624C2|nr:tRNA (guanosine(37)-N1)-methyltransferase TrmD [Prochlorococcus sp. MIT 1307]